MTEKEMLLYMIENNKKDMPTFCYGIKCKDCYYLADKYKLDIGVNGSGGSIYRICGSPFKIMAISPEQYYIEKFGYVSLVEESL